MADLRERLQSGLTDRYRIERELGRGGMATVFLAHDLRHDRPVALKVLHPELAATLGPERFQREIKLAARLQHPNILTVHDSGETDGQLWYTMPYVEGESLRDRLQREGQMGLEEALRLTREVAEALSYAHKYGVVHRDIKPENILLSQGHALIADFGIARASEQDGGAALTGTGIAVGTPAYMSPEQSIGTRHVDGRSDQYSLACILYELLAGEPPYSGRSAQAIIAKRLMSPLPDIRLVRPSVPGSVVEALNRALAPVAGDRFENTAEFGRALTGLAASTSAPPTKHPRQPAKGSAAASVPRPNVRWLAAALLLLLVALAGLWWAAKRREPGAEGGPVRLAVLPFDNLGDSADAYFADGITNEIRGKLAAIPDLQVIASSSSNEYHHTTKHPDEIGRELGVRYLLRGRVRWAKGAGGPPRVRVDPELMQVGQTEAPITKWQQPFDAPLTDVFQVQADIATRVARELQLTLTPTTRDALGQRPTKSLDAYDAYLRGLEYDRADDAAAKEQALRAFEEAVHCDSTFALAWTALAWVHAGRYNNNRDPADAEAMRRATARALQLAPDLPQAHAREGEYQTFVRHDNAKALASYEAGLRLAPNNALLLDRIGFAEMRLGRWDSAVVHLRRATQLDPRSASGASDLSLAYWYLRRYPEAQSAAERAAALQAGKPRLSRRRIGIALSEGDLRAARMLIHSHSETADLAGVLADIPSWVLDSQQHRALTTASSAQFGGNDARRSLMLTEVYRRLGDSLRTHSYADSAKAGYQQALARTPDDPELHARLGLALAYLGQRDGAVSEGRRAVEMLPISVDALAGPTLQENLARIYLLVGEPERAIETLEPLLKLPGRLSSRWLRIDPTFTPLRGNPRFERLVSGN